MQSYLLFIVHVLWQHQLSDTTLKTVHIRPKVLLFLISVSSFLILQQLHCPNTNHCLGKLVNVIPVESSAAQLSYKVRIQVHRLTIFVYIPRAQLAAGPSILAVRVMRKITSATSIITERSR